MKKEKVVHLFYSEKQDNFAFDHHRMYNRSFPYIPLVAYVNGVKYRISERVVRFREEPIPTGSNFDDVHYLGIEDNPASWLLMDYKKS